MFAVRQWPGNAADLDFRGVLEGSTAAIVAAAPVEGKLSLNEEIDASTMSQILKLQNKGHDEEIDLASKIASQVAERRFATGAGAMSMPQYAKTFLASDEYAAAAKELPFCRLWWVNKKRL